MHFNPGDVVGGRLEVVRKLGEGGIGIVYLVNDRTRDQQVALKTLKPEVAASQLAAERFMREVKATKRIDHPGIVRIHDTGRIENILFYTMDYIEGSSIADLIHKKGSMDLETALSYMLDICDVMEKVHEVVIHRDISSDNIMIQPDNTVRILDFGTARFASEESQITVEGLALGKICYAAPEQRVDSRSVDLRADLYSLGVLFFEMLTGELIIAHEPVSQYLSDIPREFDAFFEKALAQAPGDRFATAAEFSQGLKSLPNFSKQT